jgi:CTP:molybdopterin cytidylyltransferase MocA
MSAPGAVDGVLLAAGASRRMGRPKALLTLPAGGVTLIADQLARLRRAGCGRIACVLGAEADRLAPLLAPPARPCRNPDWEQGAFSSLQAGLRALDPCPRGALILPLDVPGVGPGVFDRLLAAAAGVPEAEAVVPTFAGHGGHPVWLAPATIAAVLRQPVTARLDHFLRARSCLRLPVDDRRVRGNINTPADWERYCASLGG